MHDKSLTELRAALAAKECSAVELAQHFLGRIEAHQDLNAFVDVNPELTLAQAKAADASPAWSRMCPATSSGTSQVLPSGSSEPVP